MKQQKYWQWTLVPLSLLVVAYFVCISKLYMTDLKDFQKTSPLPTDLEAEVTEIQIYLRVLVDTSMV